MVRVKVCGVRTVDDAVACVDAGADTLGVNLWPGTRRAVDVATARAIAEAVGGRAEVVAVFVDATLDTIREVRETTGIEWVQLHGREPPALVEALLPHAYKALRASGPEVVAEARRYPGEALLLDAAVPGRVGGTGRTFDWSLAVPLARERQLTIAGGLHADNVGRAIAEVAPDRVDVASGVERTPGVKDLVRVRAFVAAVRRAGGP